MSEQRPRFEILDHTAEIGIVAHGGSKAAVFENAALGMFSLMADLSQVAETEERTIEVEARDEEGLLVNWLLELLYLFEVESLLFCRFRIDDMTEQRLSAHVYGEPFDAERHCPAIAVKAVTRHLLEIGQEESGAYWARIIFDV